MTGTIPGRRDPSEAEDVEGRIEALSEPFVALPAEIGKRVVGREGPSRRSASAC